MLICGLFLVLQKVLLLTKPRVSPVFNFDIHIAKRWIQSNNINVNVRIKLKKENV